MKRGLPPCRFALVPDASSHASNRSQSEQLLTPLSRRSFNPRNPVALDRAPKRTIAHQQFQKMSKRTHRPSFPRPKTPFRRKTTPPRDPPPPPTAACAFAIRCAPAHSPITERTHFSHPFKTPTPAIAFTCISKPHSPAFPNEPIYKPLIEPQSPLAALRITRYASLVTHHLFPTVYSKSSKYTFTICPPGPVENIPKRSSLAPFSIAARFSPCLKSNFTDSSPNVATIDPS